MFDNSRSMLAGKVTSDKKRSKSKRQSSVKKIEQFYSEDMDELKKLRHK